VIGLIHGALFPFPHTSLWYDAYLSAGAALPLHYVQTYAVLAVTCNLLQNKWTVVECRLYICHVIRGNHIEMLGCFKALGDGGVFCGVIIFTTDTRLIV
jgi:hypothetical protein